MIQPFEVQCSMKHAAIEHGTMALAPCIELDLGAGRTVQKDPRF